MSTNVNLGSGRVEVSISELKRMKTSAENLVAEINSRTPAILSQAQSAANTAFREYGAGVSSQSTAVINQCSTLGTAKVEALRELEAMIHGLDKVIEGYSSLEHELAFTGSIAL